MIFRVQSKRRERERGGGGRKTGERENERQKYEHIFLCSFLNDELKIRFKCSCLIRRKHKT